MRYTFTQVCICRGGAARTGHVRHAGLQHGGRHRQIDMGRHGRTISDRLWSTGGRGSGTFISHARSAERMGLVWPRHRVGMGLGGVMGME